MEVQGALKSSGMVDTLNLDFSDRFYYPADLENFFSSILAKQQTKLDTREQSEGETYQIQIYN